jgi:IS605 OrfB family transposase
MTQTQQFTLRAKIKDVTVDPVLTEMAEQLSTSRRKLFVRYGIHGFKIGELKKQAIAQDQITARQFNSLAYEVKGALSSYQELKKLFIQKTRKKIAGLKQRIKKEESPFKLHQFKRKLHSLQLKLKASQSQLEKPSVCFGERSLFQKQFYLKENGYQTHEQWREDWKKARNSSFFLIGSKDEKFGNQTCQFLPGRLKLRVTHSLAEKIGKKFVEIPIEFTYECERIQKALAHKQALHYRFIKKENGYWYVHLTFNIEQENWVSSASYGALGIDLNPSCIAVSQIDSYGNLFASWQVPTHLRGRTSEQIKATLGHEIGKLVRYAQSQKIPIVIEKLDFENKKLQLRSRGLNRMLSQFAYSLFDTLMSSQCFRHGVQLLKENPAYTSTIGKVKFSHGYGLSTHMAAAMAIARRGLSFGERLRAKTQLRLSLPVRNREKHVWSDWRKLNPKVFPKAFILRKDRQRPERPLSEKSSSPTPVSDLARTLTGLGAGYTSLGFP